MLLKIVISSWFYGLSYCLALAFEVNRQFVRVFELCGRIFLPFVVAHHQRSVAQAIQYGTHSL